MADPIGWVVRDVTGETQLSVRFTLLSDARRFAEGCAQPVRIWRLSRIRRTAPVSEPWFDTCQRIDCQAVPTWRVLDIASGKVVRGSYNCDLHRPVEPPSVAGERFERRVEGAER